jgi:outer membrane protein OmpA-like peptidoglycan-associated protein/Mg-chelatase subunit ChlD
MNRVHTHFHKEIFFKNVQSAFRLVFMLACAVCMMLGLTACPHHIEKMIDSVAPPKGYKPSYSTSEVSFAKLKQTSSNQAPSTQAPSNQAPSNQASSTQAPDFNPEILAGFSYTTTSTTQVMTGDSSVFAGMGGFGDMKNLAKTFDLKGFGQNMNLDSLSKSLPINLPESGINLDSLQKRIAIDSTLLYGALAPEEILKRVQSLGSQVKIPDGAENQGSTQASTQPSSKNSLQKNPQKTSKKTSEKSVEKPSEKWHKSTETSGTDLEKSGKNLGQKLGQEYAEKIQEQASDIAGAITGKSMEQAFALAAVYKARAEAMMQARAAQERAEAEAYKRIAEEEERAAKKLAEKPAVMPITVDIRSIRTNRYPDEVELQVSVMDTAGRFITGLAPPFFQGNGNYREYWRALSDSSSQTTDVNSARVRRFEVQEVREAAQDTHAVAFVLDHSPSMGNARAQRLQEAVARTLGIVKRQDFISVIKFTKSIKVEVPLTNDTLEYRRNFLMDGLEGYGGGTAIYDAAIAGINELVKAPPSATKIVVLFSDGGDNSSKKKLPDVYKLAKQHGVRIFTISYGIYDDIDKMQDLAKYTGGKLYQLYSAREFPFAFGDVYKSLKNYYRVRYKPTEAASKHAVQLRLVVPELVSVSTATAEYDRSIFTPLDAVGSVQLVNIEFETGKAMIQISSMQQIRDFAAYIKRFPKMVVEVRGHTDDKGSDDLNQKLSEARAEAVRVALVQYGVQPTQVRTKGFGKAQPLVPNDSEDNRRKNRRTEFAILAQ